MVDGGWYCTLPSLLVGEESGVDYMWWGERRAEGRNRRVEISSDICTREASDNEGHFYMWLWGERYRHPRTIDTG